MLTRRHGPIISAPFLNTPRGAWIFVLAFVVFTVGVVGNQRRSSRARCAVACAGAAAHDARFFYYVITDMACGASWQTDRSVQILLDAKYRQGDVFMIVRCAQASIVSGCRFMDFTLLGFGVVSDWSPLGPNSDSVLRFSEVWAYEQSSEMLWKSANAFGLALTGQYQCCNDLDPERQACSRLLQELFGKNLAESGKVVTEKFVPWVTSMFQAANMTRLSLASSASTQHESTLGKSGAWGAAKSHTEQAMPSTSLHNLDKACIESDPLLLELRLEDAEPPEKADAQNIIDVRTPSGPCAHAPTHLQHNWARKYVSVHCRRLALFRDARTTACKVCASHLHVVEARFIARVMLSQDCCQPFSSATVPCNANTCTTLCRT